MITLDISKEVFQIILQNSSSSSMYYSLEFLENKFDLKGLALFIFDEEQEQYTILASSKQKNIQGLLLNFKNNFLVLDEQTILGDGIEKFTSQLDFDLLDNYLGKYLLKPVSYKNLWIGVFIIGENNKIVDFDLEYLLNIYQLIFKDSYFLKQVREKTNRIKLSKVGEELELRAVQKYRELLDSTSEGVIVLNESGKIIFMNRSGQEITGYSLNGIRNTHINSIVTNYHHKFFNSSLKELPDTFTIDVITTSNELVCLSVSLTSLLSDKGFTTLLFRDITQTKIIEDRLKNTAEFLINLVDNSVVPIVSAEIDRNIIVFNPAAQKLFGYSPGEIIDINPIEFLFESKEKWEQSLDKIYSPKFGGEGKLEQTEINCISKNKESFPTNMAAFLIPHYNDTSSAVVIFLTDLRQKKEMEKKIHNYQQKLKDSERQSMLSELAGAMAHELNQPLMSILGYTEILQTKEITKEKIDKALAHINNEAQRMADLVKKIGNITRYETRKYVGSATIVDFDKGAPE
jgi:PAS domain S-box-containing protein